MDGCLAMPKSTWRTIRTMPKHKTFASNPLQARPFISQKRKNKNARKTFSMIFSYASYQFSSQANFQFEDPIKLDDHFSKLVSI